MTRLGFPGTPLPIRGEMYISGAWTDITSSVRLDREVVISARGRSGEQGRPSPCTCDFTLNDRTGLLNNRNPNSAYYGLLPRNLPVRFSVTEDRSFAIIDTATGSEVKTADKAVLDITGDIDIRIEFELAKWTGTTDGQMLASKYRRTASNNRSWIFYKTNLGYLQFSWTTDGTTSTLNGVASTAPLTITGGPMAARVTMDVDNGSGQKVLKFYTSDSIAGSWTQLGATQTFAGTTSIFSGTADVELGRIDDGQNGGLTAVTGMSGRIYAFELYNGIAGTLVAEADIYNQPRGTTSFSDGLATPNTWVTAGNAEITPDDRRFTGEISALPVVSDVSGRDVYIPVQAADVTRRLGKGATAIASALKSYFSQYVTSGQATGYWPAEDGSSATTIASAVSRGAPGKISDTQFGTVSDLPASGGAITLSNSGSRINVVGRPTNNTGYACFNFAMKMPSVPASSVTVIDLYCQGGTISRINFSVTATSYNMAAYDLDGALITSNSTLFGTTTPPNVWNLFRIQLTQSGGNTQLDLGWYHPGDTGLTGAAALIFAAVCGRFTQAQMIGQTNNAGTQYAHLFMGQFYLDNVTAAYVTAANAFAGETTTTRFSRIAGENGITATVIGTSTEVMGPQPIDTPLNVLFQCHDTERGQMYPDRNSLAIVLRTRRSLVNQYGPSISYTGGELGPAVALPTDDDALLRNAVTATRPGDGSTGYATQDSGPNSTASPTASPPGVGVVPGSISPNTYLSARLADMAAHDVFLGTWDEPRWPMVQVALERQNYAGTAAKVLIARALARLDVGDMFSITHLPSFLPPDDAQVMIQGITEVLANRGWRFTWNTSAYGPYALNDLTSMTASRYRLAASGCTTAATITTTATSFTVAIAAGNALWGTTALKPGNFPQNVVIAGEVITISGISGTSSPQTFTASARSVNGIVKAHAAGETVQIQYPFYVGL